MARIAGVDLPKSKRMEVAFTYIYGIGRSIVDETYWNRREFHSISRAMICPMTMSAKIRQVIEQEYKVEGDLRRDITANISVTSTWDRIAGQRHRQKSAGAWAAHPYECPYTQRTAQNRRWQEDSAVERLRGDDMADATDEKQKPESPREGKRTRGAEKARPKKHRRRGGAYPLNVQQYHRHDYRLSGQRHLVVERRCDGI